MSVRAFRKLRLLLSIKIHFDFSNAQDKLKSITIFKFIIMKKILILSLLILASCSNKKEIKQVAEVSCGQCQFDLDSEDGCSLAVRIDNKAYFVDSFDIDDFGDAHDEHTGFCEVIRKGEITGEVVDGRFVASSIQLVE